MTINHNVVKWTLRLLMAAVVVFLIIMLMPGCATEASKLQKSENNVLANIESVKRIRATTDALFPCTNDTLITQVHDTTTNVLTNTIHHTDTIVKNGVTHIFHTDTAYFEKTKTVYQTKVVTDHELTDRQKDTITSLRLQQAAQKGQMDEVRTNLSEAKNGANKWHSLFWVLFVAAILSHVIRSYMGGWISSIFKKS